MGVRERKVKVKERKPNVQGAAASANGHTKR